MIDTHVGPCRCWKCWLQDNFTSVALLFLVVVVLCLVVVLMHEAKIDDKYVTWLEGFAGGAFSTWTLSLKTADGQERKAVPQLPQLPQLPQEPQTPAPAPPAVEVPNAQEGKAK